MTTEQKRFTIRYEKYGSFIITAVSNYTELIDLLNGSAKEAFLETKISENMPSEMHNAIAKHNANLIKF